MENIKSYSYECPRCGNMSVDYSSGDHAFEGCTELSDIKLPKNAMIADNAFNGCTKLDIE